jgi:hypothetical protein
LAIPASEVKAVVAVFNDPEFDELTERDVAERIIAALNQVRENTKRFVVVANLKWPDHEMFHMWAAGPFNTVNQANAVGETFATDPFTKRGNGRWKAVPILSPTSKPSRTAWDVIRPDPEPCCSMHHGYIKDDTERWTWMKAPEGADHWKIGTDGHRVELGNGKAGW